MIKLNIQRFGSTNKTTHYELSQFVSTDKPSWLNDYNGDMAKIDTGINSAKTTADNAATAAGNAATAAEGAQNTANTAVTNAATADGKAVAAQTDIGTLANLTTTAKTNLVAAINEVDDKIETSYSIATTKSYSCDYVNTHLQDIDQVSVEQKTNKVYIDSNGVSHDVYRKVINFNLPNTTTLHTATGITNAVIFDFEGYVRLSSNDGEIKMLPYKSEYAQTGDVDFGVAYDASDVRVATFTDRTGGYGWAILEYYKIQ